MKMCCHSLGGDNMQIGIIGAGKVGCSVGKYLQENDALRKAGYHITGYAGRRKESVEEAATFTGTTPFYLLSELVKKNDIVCVATPDSQIKTVWEELCKFSLEGKIVCHFSGSLSSDLFTGREKKGVSACSVHPMYAFSNRFTSYEQLNTVKLTIEGDPEAVAVFREIWNLCGNETGVVSTEKKMQYHGSHSQQSYDRSVCKKCQAAGGLWFCRGRGRELFTPAGREQYPQNVGIITGGGSQRSGGEKRCGDGTETSADTAGK